MSYLDVKNTCRLLDSSNDREILGQVSILATRIGYKTQFWDHNTIYVGEKSSEYLAVIKVNDLDGISSILRACSICKEKKIGFVVTSTHELLKYNSFLLKIKPKYFLITYPEPNVVLIGYNGIIRFNIRVWTRSRLTNQIQKLNNLSVSQATFLEMKNSSSSVQTILQDKDSTQIVLNVSLNILESSSLIAHRCRLLIQEVFCGSQVDLHWALEYNPWYDFSLNITNRVKLGGLHLSSTKINSFSISNFHDFLKLSRYGEVICFNYTPNTDRFSRIEDTARIYQYLSI